MIDTPRRPTMETLHGVEIIDPYRWLEDADDPEVMRWVASQNERTRAVLDSLPGRERLRDRLTPWFDVETVIQARIAGESRIFYLVSGGGRNQRTLMVREGGSSRVVFDPVEERPDGQMAIDWWHPSDDGRYVAFGLSLHGSERSTLRVRDVDRGVDLPERIPHTRASSVAWLPDASGFYYTRYPAPGSVPPGEEEYHPGAYFHALGTPVDDDRPVFVGRTGREDTLSLFLDSTGRWLAAIVRRGWSRTTLFLADTRASSLAFRSVEGLEGAWSAPIGDIDGLIYLRTDRDAPNGRVVALDPMAGSVAHTVIPETPELVIEDAEVCGDRIVLRGLERGEPALAVHERNGRRVGSIPLPAEGQLFALGGSRHIREALYGFEGFVHPPMTYRFDLDRLESEALIVSAPPNGFDPDAYVTERVWVTSADGTRVPMVIGHRRDLDRTRPAPTYLTGYGGFALTRGAEFYPAIPAFLESGGVIAGPGLRGGFEFGERWHRDGMLERKQNVFDDFIASAEWLTANGYTTPDCLAIGGGSNGGLLVGAALTQRPDLFRAVWCGVPLLDMLRYHLFLIGSLWIPEYGSADDPEQFAWLRRYSPYHSVSDGVDYPAVLFAAAESDGRVDPLHARKMAALLRDVVGERPDRPILLRMETGAGHGAGKSLERRVDEAVDQWSFLRWQLGMDSVSQRSTKATGTRHNEA